MTLHGGWSSAEGFAPYWEAAFDLESGDLTHTIWSICFNLTKRAIW